MQRTRLSTLIETVGGQIERWLVNPWRRISIVLLSLLFGFYFGVSIAAYAGQAAEQDIIVAALLVLIAEVISRVTYSRRWRAPDALDQPKPLLLESFNSMKLGASYALALEAFKLGS